MFFVLKVLMGVKGLWQLIEPVRYNIILFNVAYLIL